MNRICRFWSLMLICAAAATGMSAQTLEEKAAPELIDRSGPLEIYKTAAFVKSGKEAPVYRFKNFGDKQIIAASVVLMRGTGSMLTASLNIGYNSSTGVHGVSKGEWYPDSFASVSGEQLRIEA